MNVFWANGKTTKSALPAVIGLLIAIGAYIANPTVHQLFNSAGITLAGLTGTLASFFSADADKVILKGFETAKDVLNVVEKGTNSKTVNDLDSAIQLVEDLFNKNQQKVSELQNKLNSIKDLKAQTESIVSSIKEEIQNLAK